MKAISVDVRERVVTAFLEGEGSQKELAIRFKVSLSSVKQWVRRLREKGHLEPDKTKRGRAPIIEGENAKLLQSLIEEQADRTLKEYQQLLLEKAKVSVSESTICRALQKLKLTRKKKFSSKRTR